MYKILLGSIIAVLASSSVFGAPSLTCDASGIGATTPNARMKASWTQNTYNLEWYGDEGNTTPLTVQNSAQSCDYGDTLVLPSTNPTKVGYTFLGWEMEEIPAGFNYGSTCSSSVESTVANNYATDANSTPKPGCLDLNGDGGCSGGVWDNNASAYGITEPGQWGVRFSYGDVVGEAICSSTNGTWATAGTPDTSGSGQYCWCRAMGYKLGDSNMCAVSSPAWVFDGNYRSATDCAGGCAEKCAGNVQGTHGLRAALFGYSSSGSACLIPSTYINNAAGYVSTGCLDINGDGHCTGSGFHQNASNYGISDPGEWGVSWSNGDKVTGVALCSQTSGTYATIGTPDETGSGETQYCWCKATHYTANNAQQCSLSAPAWVFYSDVSLATDCAERCAYLCPSGLAEGKSSAAAFRAALFGSNVAQ